MCAEALGTAAISLPCVKLEEIIAKALEKDRELRYQSAAEIRTDLQRMKRDSDSNRAAAVTGQVEPKPVTSSWLRWMAKTTLLKRQGGFPDD